MRTGGKAGGRAPDAMMWRRRAHVAAVEVAHLAALDMAAPTVRRGLHSSTAQNRRVQQCLLAGARSSNSPPVRAERASGAQKAHGLGSKKLGTPQATVMQK